jgi:hypothetical protein
MNINLDEYKEVKKTEYDQHKKQSDQKYAETLRFGFRYFIKKQTTFEDGDYRIFIGEDYLEILNKKNEEYFVFHEKASLPLLKQAIRSMATESALKEQKKQ